MEYHIMQCCSHTRPWLITTFMIASLYLYYVIGIEVGQANFYGLILTL